MLIKYTLSLSLSNLPKMSLIKQNETKELKQALSLSKIISEKFLGHKIRVDEATGYICGSDICKAGGKDLYDYKRSKDAKAFIKYLSTSLRIPKKDLIKKITTGANSTRGTWVHPRLATELARWISPKFGVEITGWIEEWRKQKQENELKYIHALQTLEPSESDQQEKKIQERLAGELSAETEVSTKVGRIDLLSNTEIIEIKHGSKWKHAIGQVLSYGHYYPEHQKVIHLFDCENSIHIEEICESLSIVVRIETS